MKNEMPLPAPGCKNMLYKFTAKSTAKVLAGISV
jgi:hypothetical protein